MLNKSAPSTTQKRRQVIADVIRTRDIKTKPQMLDILDKEFDMPITILTLTRDFKHLGITKDKRDDVYVILDDRLSKYDIYDEIKQTLRRMVHNYRLTPSQSAMVFHCDAGTSQRLAMMFEALRYDEETSLKRRTFFDRIIGVFDGGVTDTVLVMLADTNAARAFNKKMDALSGASEDFEWARSPEERELLGLLSPKEDE